MTAFTVRHSQGTENRAFRRPHRVGRHALIVAGLATLAGALATPRAAMAEGSDPKWKLNTDRVEAVVK